MSRRRLERGFWNGRQVKITDKEYDRIYKRRVDRGGRYYHRHGMTMHMDWPFPTTFTLEHRLPRKTKKALWKQFNGHPETDPRNGVLIYNGFSWGIVFPTPGLLHNGRKP
jgi:hypothetical protein